jgi:Na+-translocating ferredoxin:NAD+ oxidoreductase subunit G
MNARETVRLGAILAAFAAVACVALALTNSFTSVAREQQNQKRTARALQEIFPDMDSFDYLGAGAVTSDDPAAAIDYAIDIKHANVTIGVAVAASGKSYGGDALVLVGVSLDNRVTGAKILKLSDTPGLGLNAKNSHYYIDKKSKLTWLGQFTGKGADAPFEVKKDVVAITSSTISSKAITKLIRAAARSGAAYLAARSAEVKP